MKDNIYMVIKKAKAKHCGGFTIKKFTPKPSWNYTLPLLYTFLIILTIYLLYDLRYN